MFKSLVEIAARWGAGDAFALLGAEAYSRARLIIEIDNLLHVYFAAHLADSWPFMGNRNPLFGGTTPINYMMCGGIPAMESVAKLLHGMCQHG